MSAPLEIKVPNIGDFAEVEIIEVLVAEGQSVAPEDPLITLESDKATMDIPAPSAGVIQELRVTVGQMVAEGAPIALLQPAADEPPAPPAADAKPTAPPQKSAHSDQIAPAETADHTPAARGADESPPPASPAASTPSAPLAELPHASPAVRRFARELGADLAQITGRGAHGRILKTDVKDWVKQKLQGPHSGAGAIPPIPPIDFSQFGETEVVPLSRIKKRSGPHLQRAWLNIPHVTHHDEADISALEEFRRELKGEAEKQGIRVTILGFVLKILAQALQQFPRFNASLHPDGARLIMKKYCNIGIAVDTPQGLVVPVIRDVKCKSVFELAREMGELSQRARAGKLTPDDLQGGCISVSSLGGIGGTAFTPIVNAPEVAVLGIARARMRPVWDGKKFHPRLLLPLDLSYDHRVIDGAEAARFVAFLVQACGDARRLSL